VNDLRGLSKGVVFENGKFVVPESNTSKRKVTRRNAK
jgi:hypothetical protein